MQQLPKSLFVFVFCVPLAIVFGVMLATPLDRNTMFTIFGGLLLLPKSFNASYGDLEYRRIEKGADGEPKDEGKRQHYIGQNLLAQSLHEQAYERNPGFVGFKGRSGLPFQAHAEFKKADLHPPDLLPCRRPG